MTGSAISGFGASGGLNDAVPAPGHHGEVLAFPRPWHMPWRVPGPRAGQWWVQSPFGAFQSPAGSIDPAPSIRVMHGVGSRAEPGTNVPSGKGTGRRSWQGLVENPGVACGSCQARLTPSARGHSSRTQEFPYSCWFRRCSRRVQRCPELLLLCTQSCHSPAPASGCL